MKSIAVFTNDLKRLFKEISTVLILVLMPLGFILPIGFASAGDDTAAVADKDTPLLVVDYDGGAQARELITALDENLRIERNLSGEVITRYGLETDARCAQSGPACDELIARAQLKDSSRALALVIPAGLSTAFEAGRAMTLTLLYDPLGDINLIDQVRGIVKGASIKISLAKQVSAGKQQMSDLSSIGSQEVRDAVANAASQPAPENQEAAIDLEDVAPSNVSDRRQPNQLQQGVPGYTVMFVFLVAGFMSGWSNDDKRDGIFRRLLSMPITKAGLMAGKLLFGLAVGLVQITLLFVVARVLFGVSLGHDMLAFALVTVGLSATVTALGLAAAAIKFPGSAITAPLVIGALLGGCLFSQDLLPPLLRVVSYLIPHSWAMQGYQDLMLRGYGLVETLPEIGVLFLFAVVFFAFAAWRFDPLD